MKAKKFFGFDEKFGHYAAMAGLVIITLIFCGEHFGWLGDDRYEKLKSKYREKVNLLTLQNQIQVREINELKEQLRLLESSAKKPEVDQSQPEEVQVEEETQAHNRIQVEELASMSDPEWQAMVLEEADSGDRKILESHFKRENEFKASLSRAQKQEFDAEVEKAYAHLLANSGVEGELSDWQKRATRRSAETVAMTLFCLWWKMVASSLPFTCGGTAGKKAASWTECSNLGNNSSTLRQKRSSGQRPCNRLLRTEGAR